MSHPGSSPHSHRYISACSKASEEVRHLYAVYFWDKPTQRTVIGLDTHSLHEKLNCYKNRFQDSTIEGIDALFESLTRGISELISNLKRGLDEHPSYFSQSPRLSIGSESESPASPPTIENSSWIEQNRLQLRYFTRLIEIIAHAADCVQANHLSSENFPTISEDVSDRLRAFLEGSSPTLYQRQGQRSTNQQELLHTRRSETAGSTREQLGLRTREALGRLNEGPQREANFSWVVRQAVYWFLISCDERDRLNQMRTAKKHIPDTRFLHAERVCIAQAFLQVMKSAWILKNVPANFTTQTLTLLQREILFHIEKRVLDLIEQFYAVFFTAPNYELINAKGDFELEVPTGRSSLVASRPTCEDAHPQNENITSTFVPATAPVARSSLPYLEKPYQQTSPSHDNTLHRTSPIEYKGLYLHDSGGQNLCESPYDFPGGFSQPAQGSFPASPYSHPLRTVSQYPPQGYSILDLPRSYLPVLDESRIQHPQHAEEAISETQLANIAAISHLSTWHGKELPSSSAPPFSAETIGHTDGLHVSRLEQEITVSNIEHLLPAEGEDVILNKECASEEESSIFKNGLYVAFPSGATATPFLPARMRMFKDVRYKRLAIWIKSEDQQMRKYSVNLSEDEIIPIYALKGVDGTNFEIAIALRRNQRRLRFQFRSTSNRSMDLYGFHGALTNSNFHDELRVKTVICPKPAASEGFILSGCPRVQFWTQFEDPLCLTPSWAQAENIALTERDFSNSLDGYLAKLPCAHLYIYDSDRIHIILVTDRICLKEGTQSSTKTSNNSPKKLRLVPNRSRNYSVVKMRTFHLGFDRADGLPLSFDGMLYADQDHPPFQEYHYIEIEFMPKGGGDLDAYKEFIAIFRQLLDEWKARREPFEKFRQRQRHPRVRVRSNTFFNTD